MKRWLTFALLVVATSALPGCFTASRDSRGPSGRAPRTLSPDRETAEPAVRPVFQAADTTRPAPDSLP